MCTTHSHKDRHSWARACILSQTSETPAVTLRRKTGSASHSPAPAGGPAETASGVWTARHPPAGCAQPPAHTQMGLHTRTQAGIDARGETACALTPVRAQTHRRPPGCPAHAVPWPMLPHSGDAASSPSPSRPTPPGPAGHVDEKTKIWLGRGRWAARKGRAEDEIIILPGLFISVIISGVFTPPPRPLPADPA